MGDHRRIVIPLLHCYPPGAFCWVGDRHLRQGLAADRFGLPFRHHHQTIGHRLGHRPIVPSQTSEQVHVGLTLLIDMAKAHPLQLRRNRRLIAVCGRNFSHQGTERNVVKGRIPGGFDAPLHLGGLAVDRQGAFL